METVQNEQQVAGSTQVTQAIKELVGFQDLDNSGIEQGEALSSFLIVSATLDNKLKVKIWAREKYNFLFYESLYLHLGQRSKLMS